MKCLLPKGIEFWTRYTEKTPALLTLANGQSEGSRLRKSCCWAGLVVSGRTNGCRKEQRGGKEGKNTRCVALRDSVASIPERKPFWHRTHRGREAPREVLNQLPRQEQDKKRDVLRKKGPTLRTIKTTGLTAASKIIQYTSRQRGTNPRAMVG